MVCPKDLRGGARLFRNSPIILFTVKRLPVPRWGADREERYGLQNWLYRGAKVQ